MLLFACDKCNCVDAIEFAFPNIPAPPVIFTCTECQGRPWHDHFPKQPYDPDRDIIVNRPTGLGLG